MAGRIDARLAELGITLPDAPAAAANYLPYVQTGNLIFISGQLPFEDGQINHTGKVGDGATDEQAQQAARVCGLNIIAHLLAACGGDLDLVRRCFKLGGFVSAVPEFAGHPQVINGCSDLMVDVFGDNGRHARFAVGASALPRDVTVEVDAVFEIE